MAEALRSERPQGRTISLIWGMESWIMASGVSARAKSLGVTSLTRLSVHWAERRTAMRRV